MIGTTIHEYVLTQRIGEGELDECFSALHMERNVPAEVRRLKPRLRQDAVHKARFLQDCAQEIARLGLRRDEDCFLVDDAEECALIKLVAAEEWGQRSATWHAYYDRNAGRPASFWRACERLAMFTMPLGLLLGQAAMGVAIVMCIDGFRMSQLALGLSGVAMICAAVGGAGLLQRRLWGLRLSRISYLATLFSILLLIVSRKQHFPEWMAETMSEKIEVHFPSMFLLPLILGLGLALDVVFSRRARHYFAQHTPKPH